ncbi:MAG: GAF domain-containing sensor histidine kinase [Chloroflexi bacterium]|nr:GAF domain-containing sensor histidine kinase [Chloroflexota bacterium]
MARIDARDRIEFKLRPTLKALRWASIILPVVFLIGFDRLRHTVFVAELHSTPAFIAVYAIIVVGVVGFSYAIFGFIGSLQSRLVEQNRHLTALNKIALASAEKPAFLDLLKTSLDEILLNLKADSGLICLVDQEKEEHSAVCHRGFSDELANGIRRAKLGDDPIAAEVVRTGRAVVMERVFDHPRVAEIARREGIRSAISAPLKYEGKVNGILAIGTREERHFSEADQASLESIGGQLGMAISNATLYEQSRAQNRDLTALLSIVKVTSSSLNVNEVLDRSLVTIIEVTSADAAEIWLIEGEEELVMRCHRGTHAEAFLEQERFRLGEGIPGIVAQQRINVLVHDLPSDPRFTRQRVTEAGFHTFCAMPLLYRDRLVGVLAVAALSADAMREQRELGLLEGIGEWLSLAVEHAHLYCQVQDQAVLSERERLAREMHDGMAQLLGYINTQTIAVKKLLSDSQVDLAREELKKMEEVTRDLYADVREGIVGLRIASRQPDGLLVALRQYADRYAEMSGVQVVIQVHPGVEAAQLAPSAEIQVMRIIQEALTNVRKHSKTTVATVTFNLQEGGLNVSIADNGIGFDPLRLHSTGWPRFGLQTMHERAEAIGGCLHLDAAPGSGTRVEIQLPLNGNGGLMKP